MTSSREDETNKDEDMQQMNKEQAIAVDKDEQGRLQVWIDKDDDTGIVCLDGINSGWAYCSPPDPRQCVEEHSNFVLI